MSVVSNVIETNRYKKNRIKMQKRGRKIEKLDDTVEDIKNYRLDNLKELHPLTKGKYAGNMDCHIEGDWVLIWRYENDDLILVLTDTGDHQMLFEETFEYDDSPNISASELFDLDYLYHATYFPYWKEIRDSGYIKPNMHKNWDISDSDSVYLSGDIENAISYAETSENAPEEYLDEIVVLEIDINKLNLDKLDIDHNQAYWNYEEVNPEDPATWIEFEYHGEIPVSAIHRVIQD